MGGEGEIRGDGRRYEEIRGEMRGDGRRWCVRLPGRGSEGEHEKSESGSEGEKSESGSEGEKSESGSEGEKCESGSGSEGEKSESGSEGAGEGAGDLVEGDGGLARRECLGLEEERDELGGELADRLLLAPLEQLLRAARDASSLAVLALASATGGGASSGFGGGGGGRFGGLVEEERHGGWADAQLVDARGQLLAARGARPKIQRVPRADAPSCEGDARESAQGGGEGAWRPSFLGRVGGARACEMPSHVYDDARSLCTTSSDSSTLTMS
jgi:hypothetical protein